MSEIQVSAPAAQAAGYLSSPRQANISANLEQATADLTATTNNNNGNQLQGGKSVQQQYDRIRILGKGSFGAAIVHRRRADCSLVVLKEIDLSRFRGERERKSAIQEAQIMSTLNHINIIKYHNAYTTDTKLIIEMEYASIGTLAHFLTFQVNPLEEQEILIIFRQITSGLNYLHSKNIIHLDLKMANIFITIEGLIKIGDFGIAQYITTATSPVAPTTSANEDGSHNDNNLILGEGQRSINKKQTATSNNNNNNNSQLGTLAYSSPERCLGEQTDFKSDIWSLGCILYELICAKPLFSGDSLPELVLNITRIHYSPIKRNGISANLRETFEQMIAREPELRPSAKDLLCVTGQLLSRLQLQRHKVLSKRQSNNHHHRFDLSTEVAMIAANNNQHQDDQLAHINYPHSLVYQVRLDSRHIHVDRVNLPQTKRIKEISKGRSHYLVLTYDNIVYGWGTKNRGQLGACGLTSSSSNQAASNVSGFSSGSYSNIGPRVSQSARNSISTRDFQFLPMNSPAPGSSAQNLSSSSTLNISAPSQSASSLKQQPVMSKQLVMSMLQETQPTSRPFIINELNHRKIIQTAAGNDFSVFLSKTGIVMTCGDGSTGCLGRGDLTSCFTPCMVESLLNTDVVCIACGPEHVVAVCGNGRAFAWGKNRNGRLGIQAPRASTSLSSSLSSSSSSSSSNSNNNKDDDNDIEGNISRQQQQNHGLSMGKFTVRPEPVQLPSVVSIKSVFCGDKSTILIDSENRCWACGENSFNKLGLDIQRRFKRTLIVDSCSTPTEITSLGKHKIVSCNIGKKHSTFITSEGKLIVFGQDIDHTYRLQSNIICGRDSHRRISFELQTSKRRKDGRLGIKQANSMLTGNILAPNHSPAPKQKQGWIETKGSISNQLASKSRAPSYKQLTQSTLFNNQLVNFKRSIDSCEIIGETKATMMKRTRRKIIEYPKYKLNKLQRQQIESYVRKSRSSRKMPFECVIGASCTPKFTLALTNDNRVYFWGTRSHKKEGFEELNPPLLASQASPRASLTNNKHSVHSSCHCRRCSCSYKHCLSRQENRQLARMTAAPKSVEPQLVAGCSDECFVKIGATNNSLMSNIQVLGSDQPIIHAQDPRLIAQSLADLWILDYKPTSLPSSSSASNSSRSSSSPSSPNLSHNSSSSTLASSCSACSACSCQNHCEGEWEKENSLDANCSSSFDLQYYNDHFMGHDAILKPQPIVSLYVPSIYNHHNGCSINLVDLFCFDEDRFYLVLDTTLKLQQYQHHNSRPASANALNPPTNTQQRQANTRLRLGSVNEAMVGSHLRSAAKQQQLNELATNSAKPTTSARAETVAINASEKQNQQQQQQLKYGSSTGDKPKNSSSMRLSSRPATGSSNARISHRGSLLSNVVGESPAGSTEKCVQLGLDMNPSLVATVAPSTATIEQQAATTTCYLQAPAIILAKNESTCEDERDRDDNNNSRSSANNNNNNNNLVDIINDNCSNNVSNQELNQSDNNVILGVCSSSQGGGVSLEEPRSLSTFVAPIVGNHHMLVVGGPTMRTLDDQTLRPLNFEARRGSSRRVVDGEELDDDASGDVIFDAVDQLGGIPVMAAKRNDQYGRRRNRRQLNKSESTTFTGNIDIDETSSMPSWVRNEFIQQQQQQQQQQGQLSRHSSNSEAGLFVVDCSSTTEEDTFMSGVSAATEMTLDGNNDDDDGDNQQEEEDESSTTPIARHSHSGRPAENNSRVSLSSATSSSHCSMQTSRRQLSVTEATLAHQADVVAVEAKEGATRGAEEAGWHCSKLARVELCGKAGGLQVSGSQPDNVSSNSNNTANETQTELYAIGGNSSQHQQVGGCSLVRRASSIVNNSDDTARLLLLAAREQRQQAAGIINLLDCDVYRASSGVARRNSAGLACSEQHYQSSNLNSAFSSLANSQHLLINNNASTNLDGGDGLEQLHQQQWHSCQSKRKNAMAAPAVTATVSVPEINQSSSFDAIRAECLPGGDRSARESDQRQATSMSQPELKQSAPSASGRDPPFGSSQSAASSSSQIAAAAERAAATRAKASSCSSLASLRRSLMKLFC